MKYLIGIDIGTSGTKSVLFDLEGNVIASELVEYPLYQPQNGWAEQDPEDWWQAVVKSLKAITPAAENGEICGIGLSGQMHGLVMLDGDGEVIRNSIIWCDGRTVAECEEIEEIIGHEKVVDITANPALPGFTASKIMWVKKHEPENYAKCAKILLPKDYIRYKLTGEYARGWRYDQVTSSYGLVHVTVYNETKPQLTHLLEFGHELRRGGRKVGDVKAFSHILSRRNLAEKLLMKKIEEQLK